MTLSRRTFLKTSALAAAGATLPAKAWGKVLGANADIRVAVIGLNGRGRNHLSSLARIPGVRVVALCDVDSAVLAKVKPTVNGGDVKTYTDLRKLFDDKDVDAVTIATPNHWHSLAAIWALQAGKDVYVEKPVSHEIWEGRQLVNAANKYKDRVVQVGTQIRSGEGLQEAVQFVQSGQLGKILASRGFCYKRRDSLGLCGGPQPVPATIDYNLWSGAYTQGDASSTPAPAQSPVSIPPLPCAPYNNLQISMEDIKGAVPQEDASRNSFIVNYNGAKFSINGNSYTSKLLTFRAQPEHILPKLNASALEMQIEMENDVQGKAPAVLSFLVLDIGDNASDIYRLEHYRVYNNNKVVESLQPQNWTINLNQVGEKLMAKEAQAQFLNMYTYNGTFTHTPSQPATWYVLGSELLAPSSTINSFRNLVQTATQFNPSDNVVLAATDSSNIDGINACYTSFFSVTIGHTYAIWFGIAIILIFFIMTLWLSEKPIKNPRYKVNPWTHHPFYSVKFYGNDLHTRKSRGALILCMITLNAMFSSLFYNQSQDPMRGSNIIVFAVYSALISFCVTFFLGNVLRWYYVAKHEFYQTKEESWDQSAQNRLFLYYTLVFAIIVVSWPVCVWMMNGLNEIADAGPSNMWIASFFVGIGLEVLIFYPFECLLASKSEGFRNFIRRRGFLYDEVCHETYLTYVKTL